MAELRIGPHSVRSRAGETVLDALCRAAMPVSFSCKSGVCGRCVLWCVSGEIPPKAQLPESSPWVRDQALGAFLACQCVPSGDMELSHQALAPQPPANHGAEPPASLVDLPQDLSLWQSLGNGRVVREVLQTFYQKVYADPLLSSFFSRVTLDRIVGKQYAFLRLCMTAEPGYLGERPRNAHHWMVISDALFEHRMELLRRAQLAHGLSADQIERWNRYEFHFRQDIVKSSPWPRRVGPHAIDTERHDHIELSEATLCDYCGGEIARGSTVTYHARLGLVACGRCGSSNSSEKSA